MHRIKLGRNYYIYRSNPEHQADRLIITAHACYIRRPDFGKQTGFSRNIPGLGGWFNVPENLTLFFYGPHGQALLDPGLSNVMYQRVSSYERIGPGKVVRNYRFGKYSDPSVSPLRISENLELYSNFVKKMSALADVIDKKFDRMSADSSLNLGNV